MRTMIKIRCRICGKVFTYDNETWAKIMIMRHIFQEHVEGETGFQKQINYGRLVDRYGKLWIIENHGIEKKSFLKRALQVFEDWGIKVLEVREDGTIVTEDVTECIKREKLIIFSEELREAGYQYTGTWKRKGKFISFFVPKEQER